MLIASQYHLWCRLSSGSVFAPEFPRPLTLLFNWAFGTILLLVAFQLALDLAALAEMAVRHGAVAIAAPLWYGAGGLAMILAAIGVSQAVRAPPLRNLTVEIANLSPAFDGYRLIQLSDLHISRLFPERWARAVVAATNDLQANLIVVTGDARPDLDAALVGAPEGAPVILLDHQPKMAPEAARRGVALQLSGHTHGDMIRGLDRIVARAKGGYVSERYDVGGMILYVNNGTGLWPGFALKLGRSSELTQITICRKLSRL